MASSGPATALGGEHVKEQGHDSGLLPLGEHNSAAGEQQQSRKASYPSQFPSVPPSRPSIDAISNPPTYSLESLSNVRPSARGQSQLHDNNGRPLSRSRTTRQGQDGTWGGRVRVKLRGIWQDQKGIILIVLAQFFASTTAATARYLEITKGEVEPMSTFQVQHPVPQAESGGTLTLQILLVRMFITMTASLAYMWIRKVPDAPFGPREVRWPLMGRGFCGFFGVFGLYFSLMYLPLAEATVITFIAPLLAAWVASVLLKTPFTRIHKIAGFISMAGVVLIAQPFHFRQAGSTPSPSNGTAPAPQHRLFSRPVLLLRSATSPSASDGILGPITPSQRAIAVCFGLLGVCGTAGAYTCIMKIGKRAHPLISVNYFATWCALISLGALAVVPDASFRLPSGTREWLLIAFLGVSGFVMQFLLTAALSLDRGGTKRLNMVYTQMLFAVTIDKIVWGIAPSWISIAGSSLILGSAIWVAMTKDKDKDKDRASGEGDEELGGEREMPEEGRRLVDGDEWRDDGDDGGDGTLQEQEGGIEEHSMHVIGSEEDEDEMELSKMSSR